MPPISPEETRPQKRSRYSEQDEFRSTSLPVGSEQALSSMPVFESSKRDTRNSKDTPSRGSPMQTLLSFYERKRELACISDDPHGEEEHAQWDEVILRQRLEPGVDLLMTLVAQCKTMNQKYADEREATGLYQSSNLLREALKTCHDAGSYRSVRNAVILQAPKVWSTWDLIERYLKDNLSQMASYASGAVQIKEWDSSPRLNLHIPGGPRGIYPELLMHEIGKWSAPGEEMAGKVAQAFRAQHSTFVFNVSGAGKTRLMFEGLCQNWGFYFSCAVDSESPHGSRDLMRTIGKLQSSVLFATSVAPMGDDHSRVAENRDMTYRVLLQVWLSRLLLFKQYLTNLPTTTTREESRRRWLILQVFPTALLEADGFANLIAPLYGADTDFILRKIEETYGSIKELLPSGEPLFAVFDEAQVAARQCGKAFLSDDYERHTPILGEIIATWERVAPSVTLIVSGTCPFTDVRRNSVSSPIGAADGWSLFTTTGTFDNQEAQERYILKYIWPEVKEKIGLPCRERLLLDRAWRWLRGRYRATVSFVSTLLRIGVETAHPFLNYYIQWLTEFTPTDFLEFDGIQLPESSKRMIEKISPLNFKGLDNSEPLRLRHNIFQVFLRSLFGSGTLVSSSDQEHFVKIGIAHICEPSDSGLKDIHLDEPVLLMSLSTWFHSKQREGRSRIQVRPEDISSSTCDYNTPLLETLAFYLRCILDGEMHLDDIVEFASERPTWANEPVRLITIMGQASDGTTRTCTVSPTEGPSPILGIRSPDEEDMTRWLKDSDGIAFCFPYENFGADIVFLINVGGRYIWVTVQSYLHAQDSTLTKDYPECATHSPELNLQESSPPLSLRPYPVPPTLGKFCFDSTGRQNQGVIGNDPDSVLRLIASYPTLPDGISLTKLVKDSPSPLGFVNMERFLENMRPLIPQIDRELGI